MACVGSTAKDGSNWLGVEVNIKELLKHYEDGRRNFLHATITDGVMPHHVFAQSTFQRAYFVDVVFPDTYVKACFLGASFDRCNFDGSRLTGADFSYAVFTGCSFRQAGLRGACFQQASLQDVDFDAADLVWADLRETSLSKVSFSRARLHAANFVESSLFDVDFQHAAITHSTAGYWPIMPEGEVRAWKKLGCVGMEIIVELLVPAHAKRSSATTRKCRVSEALVLSMTDRNGPVKVIYNKGATYRVGQTVFPDSWNPDRWRECSHGIHCFLTREEAEAWNL